MGRLAQGNDAGVEATDCIDFIAKEVVPKGTKVTYANMICDKRPLKAEPLRVRITVGGEKLEYLDDTGSPAASLLETIFLINSVISDAKVGATFFSADLKDFFLASPMTKPKYMRIKYKYFPQDINIATILIK